MTLTTVFPAFNNEISIGTLVLIAKKHTNHVVVVDDGSTDRTVEMAQLAGAEVILHRNSMGKGAALKSGFEYVGRNGTKVIIAMDPEGQYDPEDIPELIAPILSGETDVVKGYRPVNANTIKKSFYPGKDSLYKVFNFKTGSPETSTQNVILAFAKHTLPALRFKSNGHTTGSEMLMDAANAGFRVKEVVIGVKHVPREPSKNISWRGLKILVRTLEDIELNKPLYYMTAPGMLCTMLGIGMGLNFLKNFYSGESLSFGPTLLMMALTLLGVFLAFTGIILHAVARLINENKTKNGNNRRNPEAVP